MIDLSGREKDDIHLSNVKQDIINIRTTICNSFLFALAILMIPALIASLSRAKDIGWQPVMALHIFLVLVIWVFFLLKNRIPYQIKAGYIVLLFLIVGISGMIQFGLISGAVALAIISPVLAALLLGTRMGAITVAVMIISISIIAFSTVSGYLKPSVNLETYHSSLASWIAVIFSAFFISASITLSINMFNRYLIEAITSSRKRERELKQHQLDLENIIEEKTRELTTSNKELLRYAQVVAHDINSPLTGISGFAQLLQAKLQDKLDNKTDAYLQEIINSSNYISDIIKEQLATSKVKKTPDNLVAIDMDHAITQAIHQISHDIERTNTQVTLSHFPSVLGVETQIIRIFQNILINAIKYRSQDRGLSIEITSGIKDGMVLFAIADNGKGIEADQLDKIFEIYHQANIDNNTEGLGIGLSSCKQIIEHHGGKIWVESEPGKGSVFYITLKPVGLSR